MQLDTCLVISCLCTIIFAVACVDGRQSSWPDASLDRRSKRWASPWKPKEYPLQLEKTTPSRRFKRWISSQDFSNQFRQPIIVRGSWSQFHQQTSGFHNQGDIRPRFSWLQMKTLAPQYVRWNQSWPVNLWTAAGPKQVGLPALRATLWLKQKNDDRFDKHYCHFIRNPNFRSEMSPFHPPPTPTPHPIPLPVPCTVYIIQHYNGCK